MELFNVGVKVQLGIQNAPTQGLGFLFIHQKMQKV